MASLVAQPRPPRSTAGAAPVWSTLHCNVVAPTRRTSAAAPSSLHSRRRASLVDASLQRCCPDSPHLRSSALLAALPSPCQSSRRFIATLLPLLAAPPQQRPPRSTVGATTDTTRLTLQCSVAVPRLATLPQQRLMLQPSAPEGGGRVTTSARSSSGAQHPPLQCSVMTSYAAPATSQHG